MSCGTQGAENRPLNEFGLGYVSELNPHAASWGRREGFSMIIQFQNMSEHDQSATGEELTGTDGYRKREEEAYSGTNSDNFLSTLDLFRISSDGVLQAVGLWFRLWCTSPPHTGAVAGLHTSAWLMPAAAPRVKSCQIKTFPLLGARASPVVLVW